jgi:hypothetical protein
MKKLLFFLFALFFYSNNIISQNAGCTPDTIDNPSTGGELYPSTLPPSTLGEPYYQVISIYPPAQSSGFTLTKIQIDQLVNIPDSLQWETNSGNTDDYLYVGNWYCIEISGIPVGPPGIYDIQVWINAWIEILGNEYPAPGNPNHGGTIPFDVLPRIQTISGGGYACSGDTLFSVTIDNTDHATTYWLFRNGVNQLISIQGTGSAISFTNIAESGDYTVWATGNYDNDPTDSNYPTPVEMLGLVSILYLPVVDLGADISMSVHDTITISPGDWFQSYSWNTGSNLSFLNLIGNDLGVGQHEFYVSVQDSIGCVGSDTVIVSVFDPTGISEKIDQVIKIFPNPAQDYIYINVQKQEQDLVAEIFDIFGKSLITQELHDGLNLVYVEMLSKGYYIIQVYDQQSKFSMFDKFLIK